jgi:hypothetical protein
MSGNPHEEYVKFYDTAEQMFLSGMEIKAIADELMVNEKKLYRWRKEGSWEAKRQAALENPKTIGEMLREVLRSKVSNILQAGDISVGEAEELAKISTLIEKIEKESYQFMTAAVEVMRNFTDYIKVKCSDQEEYMLISHWVQGWFRSLKE